MATVPIRQIDWSWDLATLRLYHPRNPDPDPLLAIVRSKGDASRNLHSARTSTAAELHVAAKLRRMLVLLRMQGRDEEQQWVDETCRKILRGAPYRGEQQRRLDFSEWRDSGMPFRRGKPTVAERQKSLLTVGIGPFRNRKG